MPQLGNDKNPIIMNGSKKKKSTRVLGMLGSAYSGSYSNSKPALKPV